MDLTEELINLKDEKQAKFQSGLCPGCGDILGVKIPVLKSMAKKLASENNISILDDFVIAYSEQRTIFGLIIAYFKSDINEKFKYVKMFVKLITSWAECDVVACAFKFIKADKQLFLEKFEYLKSGSEYEKRFFFVILLAHYVEEGYLRYAFKCIEEDISEEYYVKMAKAWLVSVLLVKFYEQTMQFLKEKKLDEFTLRKSVQKAKESFRISDDHKTQIALLLKRGTR